MTKGNTSINATTLPKYVLQHSEEELRRLEAQGSFLRSSTRDFLQRVGIEPGMRVLDIGCGVGDVSFLAAELTAYSGEIIGVDRSEEAIATAAARASAKGLTNVRFLQCDYDHIADLAEGPFDAVISRLVIIHHPQPVEAIGRLIRLLRPGGVFGFQEVDVDARYWSTHPLTALDQLYDCIDQVCDRKLFARNLSGAFMEALDAAGIVERRIIRSGALESAGSNSVYPWLGGFVRTLKSVAGELGIEVPHFGTTSFEEQLKWEVERKGAIFAPVHFLGAAGRVPVRYLGSDEKL